jgi:3D (Asp-Asp-Asp) domain-containing protein
LKGLRLYAALAVAVLSLYPSAAIPSTAPQVMHVTWRRDGLLTWERVERRPIEPPTVAHLTINLISGRSSVMAKGAPGVREIYARYAQRNGGPVHRVVLWSRVLRAARPRIVAEGMGGTPLSLFEARSIAHMAVMARTAILMVATAYTADSAGGGGMTAIGRRAGFGIVAVDPRVIPLGTRLFIPGYGFALAGDTGGDIVGHRIDLGFDSLRDAMLFGIRSVTVYPLK